MDRRTLIAILLCFGIFLGWQKLYGPNRGTPPAQTQVAEQAAPSAGAVPPAGTLQNGGTISATTGKPVKLPDGAAASIREVRVKGATVTISSGSSMITDWQLDGYKRGESKVQLGVVTNSPDNLNFAFDSSELGYLSGVNGKFTEQTDRSLVWQYADANIQLERRFTFSPDSPVMEGVLTAKFLKVKPKFAFLSVSAIGGEGDPEAMDHKLAYWAHQSIEATRLKDGIKLVQVQEPTKWVAALNRYFVFAVINNGANIPGGLTQPTVTTGGRASLVYPIIEDTVTIPFKTYFGAKDLKTLHDVEPTLDHTVDFGWFTVVAYPLLRMLKWFYPLVHNYGIAIILLTMLVKLITLPLTYKSMKSMQQMAKLQPQLKKLQEKYKDDREALNREMIGFMKNHGYNPMAGCWPMLIQMPIFFALYRVLYSSVELYQAPFGLWIHDLSMKDPLYIMPVLVTLTWWLQQKLSPQTSTDPMQKRMMQFMPLVFGVFMISLPAGLGIYFFVNASLSIVQQLVLNKKLGVGKPVVTS